MSDLKISRNVNSKLVNQAAMVEQKCWKNEQSSRRECIEISEIPQSIGRTDLEKTVLNVFEKTYPPDYPQNIKKCHRLKSDDTGPSNIVIVKFSKRKDIVRVMNRSY